MEQKNTISLADYKKKNRKQTITPSGLEVEVRSLTVADFFGMGKIPQAFITGDKEAAMKAVADGDVEFVKNITKHVLLKCVKLIGKSQGGKIVDKSSNDCNETELSAEDIDREDSTFLVNLSLSQSGLSKEAAQEAKPFRAESEPPATT